MLDHPLLVGTSSEFLTIKALGTFTGASTATVLVSNTLSYLLRKEIVWLPFVVAVGFAALQSDIVGVNWHAASTYPLILLNGILLFFTALGANQTLVSVRHPQETSRVKAQGRERHAWLTSWV